mgnify:CR=1 FL=1
MPRVSSLLLEAVICVLSFRRFDNVNTAIRLGSGAQALRSKPLCVALSQVGYFFVSADGLYVLASNQAAARAMPRLSGAIEAASRAAMGHLAAPDARGQ